MTPNLTNITSLYSEVLYAFTLIFFDEMGKIDENVYNLSKRIAPDEVLESSAIPPICTIFILNECIAYEKQNNQEGILELTNDAINKLADSAFDKYDNYISLYLSSKKSTLPVEGKMIN